ncbi:MAG: phosphoribosylaminoimidazolesuccinocarboxamide synthase [Candidatus Omnitrophota bacterium]|nr:MAG: phosphoribosylaminoimidazolesuccinocarboxamide synthase [Candidatus Omnitrophota bacterium]
MRDKSALFATNLERIPLLKRGKVRDIYALGDNLLIISTDRISCFDVVLPDPIPHKGRVLTQLSAFWFNFTKDIISNHLITTNIEDFPQEVLAHRRVLEHRSMLVKKAEAIPVECVVRGYLCGSAWKEYQRTYSICGQTLPRGLKKAQKLDEPIFTPATKEDKGHDINVSQTYVENMIGKDLTKRIKEISLSLYKKASEYAEKKGLIIADTKFEFGINNNQLLLIDELLTPDSSRFWLKDSYSPGREQINLDKQFVRDYLSTINWDKNPPAPSLPEEIIAKTSEKYLALLRIIIDGTQNV